MKILNNEQAKFYQRPALNRGHIVFTSLIKFNQRILFLNPHIERLLKGADFLFPEHGWKQNYEAVQSAVEAELKDVKEAYLRLTIFDDVLHLEKRAFEVTPEVIKLTEAVKIKTPGLVPAFLKLSNYLESDLEVKRAKEKGFDDVLFSDHLENAAEASTSNIFIVTALGDIKTPPTCSYVLQGITRDKLSECIKKHGLPVSEEPIGRGDLEKASEIWLTNAVKGVRFVSQFQSKTFKVEGSHYEKIMKLFGRYGEKYE